jgi:hypothetical protein
VAVSNSRSPPGPGWVLASRRNRASHFADVTYLVGKTGPLNRTTASDVKNGMKVAAVNHRFVVQGASERTVTTLSVASVPVAAGTDPEAAYAAGGRQP